MNHDRIHAREPTHDRDRWSAGTVVGVDPRDGHCVVTVRPDPPDGAGHGARNEAWGGEPVELVVTVAVRDLVVRRLDLDAGESPVGERVWYRERGG